MCGLMYLALGPAARARTSPLLYIETMTRGTEGPLRLTFHDGGTGATNYVAQFARLLEGVTTWADAPGATLTPLDGQTYRVEIPDPEPPNVFYRVVALTPGGPIVANFAASEWRVTESGTTAAVIRFNTPFTGALRYTVSGTAQSQDFRPLSGIIQVTNSLEATIPITLTDNETIDELKYLELRLEPGPGIQAGPRAVSRMTIEENDAEWSGTMRMDRAALGFILRIIEFNGTLQAGLNSSPAGFFPEEPTPCSIQFTRHQFQVDSASIPLPPETTLLHTPSAVTLLLKAENGKEDQSVEPDHVRGEAVLVTRYEGKSYLDTTNRGRFYLLKQAVAPSTRPVELQAAP